MVIFITIAIITLLLFEIWLVKKVRQKADINRWIVGFIGPFLIIIPLLMPITLSRFLWGIILFLFTFTNIYFFESTRELVENNKF